MINTPQTPQELISTLEGLLKTSPRVSAIDYLYDEMDSKMLVGDFAFCDEVLRIVATTKTITLPLSLLLSFLTITSPFRASLSARPSLVNAIENRDDVREMSAIEINELLEGLR